MNTFSPIILLPFILFIVSIIGIFFSNNIIFLIQNLILLAMGCISLILNISNSGLDSQLLFFSFVLMCVFNLYLIIMFIVALKLHKKTNIVDYYKIEKDVMYE